MRCSGLRLTWYRSGFAALLWLVLATFAAAAEFHVLVDSDNNKATGCTVQIPTWDGAAFAGVDEILITTVDTSAAPATIRGIARKVCVNGAFTAPTVVDTSSWPAGTGLGVAGFDAIETYVPLGAAPAGTYRLGFVYGAGPMGVDAPTSTADGTGAPFAFSTAKITVAGPASGEPIPTLAHGALFLLALAVAAIALYTLRRYRAPLMLVVAVLSVVVAGTTWAAIALDGLIADWKGVPVLASDPVGDAPAGSDMSAVFAVHDPDVARLYVRADVNTQAGRPKAVGAATTTSIASLANPSAVGQAVTFAANVTNASATAVTGTLLFLDGVMPLGPAVPIGKVGAQFTTAALTAGSHSITAYYSGDATNAPSTSPILTQVVNKSATTTGVVSSLNPSSGGQAVTFTATVSGPAALPKPQGTVTFYDGAAVLASGVALDAAGKATFTSSTLAAGAHPISVAYAGGPAHNGSTSATVNQVVNGNPAAAALISAPNPSAPGQSVTLTATVSAVGGGPTPSGKVVFNDGAAVLGTAALNAAGQATLVTMFVVNGAHPLTAAYVGDKNFGPATSPVHMHFVNSAPIAVNDSYSVTHDATLVVQVGTGILANDNVGVPPAAGVGTVTGSGAACAAFPCAVTTTHGSATVNANGSFTYVPAPLFAGTDTFTYTISNVNGTSGATVTITVTDLPPVVDLNGPPAGIDYGPVTFTEGGGPIAIVDSAQLGVTDADSATLASATAVITNLLDGAAEILSVTCPTASPGCSGGILAADVTYTPATGTLLISKVAPLADYQTLLRTLRYDNASANPNTTMRDIAVAVSDGIVSNSPLAHAFVNVNAVNSPPTVTAPATASTPPNTPIVFNGNVSVGDPDAGGSPVKVTLTATNGIATLSGTAGLAVTGNGTASVVATGPLASQNAALNGMSFTPALNYSGAASLKIDIDDQGNSGSGGPMTASKTIAITVDATPTVTTTVPTNGAVGVLPAATITINFSEAVNATLASFKLECPAGTPKAFTISASPAASFTLTPSVALPPGVVCTVTVVAAQVTDVSAGQNITADYVFSFTVNTLPTVTTTVPANGATGVLMASVITVNFSEAVNATLVSFTLECPSGTPKAFTLSASPASSFTLTPTGALPAGTTCSVVVLAAGITDVDGGQNMAADYPFSFTTAVPPAITSANNATFTVGQANTFTVTTTGSPGVTSIVQGGTALPPNVTFNYGGGTTGTLSGIPLGAAQVGTYLLTITASNGVPPDAVQNPFTLNVACPVLNILPAALADGVYNALYGPVAFSASGGSGTYSFTLGSGSPPGLSFTGANLGGTPTSTGAFTFAVTVSDTATGCTGMRTFTNVHVGPNVQDDSYGPMIGNVLVDSGTVPYSVTGNDQFPAGATITSFDATSTQGGTVAMTTSGANIGRFTYDPPRGKTTADTFTYTVTSNGESKAGTVTITFVASKIWFIDNNGGCASNCDGRQSHPYTNVSTFNAANSGAVPAPQAGDSIFLATGLGNYNGPLTLQASQKLIGQGATASLASLSGLTAGAGQALPATGGTRPSVTHTTTNLTVSTNNLARGLNVGSTAGSALFGTSFSNLAMSEASVLASNTSGPCAAAVNLQQGAGTAAIAVSLTRVDATSCTNGIVVANTSGSFVVVGGGSTGSGGVITTSSGDGVKLTSVAGPSIAWMDVTSNALNGINGSGVSALTLDRVRLLNNTNANNLAGLWLANISGTSNVTNTTVSGSTEDNVHVANSSTTGTIVFDAVTVTDNSVSSGNIGIGCFSQVTGNLNCTVKNSTFHGNRTNTLHADAADGSTLSATFTNNVITAGSPNQGNLGIQVSKAVTSNVPSFTVSGNRIGTPDDGTTKQPLINSGIIVFSGASAGTMSGVVTNNIVIQDPAGPNSGSGIVVNHAPSSNASTSTLYVKVDGNQVGGSELNYGIQVDSGGVVGATGTTQVQVTNNVVATNTAKVPAQGVGALDAIRIGARRATTACYRISGNAATTAGAGFFSMFLRKADTSLFQIEGMTAGLQSDATAIAYEVAQNPLVGGPGIGATAGNLYTGVAAGACNSIPP